MYTVSGHSKDSTIKQVSKLAIAIDAHHSKTYALEQKPSATCLEQVAHLMKVDRSAVDELIEQLETHCVVCYCAVLNVRRYGDNFVLQK